MRNSGNHAINQPSRRNPGPSTRAIDPNGSVKVWCDFEPKEVKTLQKTAKFMFAFIGASPGRYLHNDGFRHGDHFVLVNQIQETQVNRVAARPIKFDPRRGVNKYHGRSMKTSSGTSPIECEPRMARASSRVIGWPAR